MKSETVWTTETENNAGYRDAIFKSAAGEQKVMEYYDRILGDWPVPYFTQTAVTRHGDTFMIVSGPAAAPSLILLHGAASNALSWIGDIARYIEHFRVYAVDIVGDPGKSAPSRPSWDGPGYAEWLEDIVNYIGAEKVILLGLSQGGWTALKYAVSRPERVAKLVLLTPAGIMPTNGRFVRKAVLYSMLGRRGASKLNRYVFGKQPIDPAALEFMNLIMTHFKARIERENIFSDAELRRLQMPVLLLGGKEDVVRPVGEIADRMRRLVPGLQTEIVPEIGHVLINMADLVVPFLIRKSN